jgi:hypothetical protein
MLSVNVMKLIKNGILGKDEWSEVTVGWSVWHSDKHLSGESVFWVNASLLIFAV